MAVLKGLPELQFQKELKAPNNPVLL